MSTIERWSPAHLWRAWDQDWQLAGQWEAQPPISELADARALTVDYPNGGRDSWRVVNGQLIPERQMVEAITSAWRNLFAAPLAGLEDFVTEEVEHFPCCPHPWCPEEWHGLAITQRMRDMRRRGVLDPGYRYSADDSPVMCPGSLFQGEFTPPPDDVEQLIDYARNLALDAIASIAGLPQSDQFSRRYHLPTDAAEVTARHLRDDPRLAGIPIHTTEPGSSSSD